MSSIKFGVLTVSDKCSAGKTTDTSGEYLVDILKKTYETSDVLYSLIPDEKEMIVKELKKYCDVQNRNVIITTGGTGFSSRDITPEATKEVIEREANGITTAITLHSLKITPFAMLSRASAGIRGKTLIINLPGSLKAVTECFEVFKNILPHAVNVLCDNIQEVENKHSKINYSVKNYHVCPHKKPATSTESKVDISRVALRKRESPYPMVEMTQALEVIDTLLKKQAKRTSLLPLEDSLGHVLAENVKAHDALPPFPASVKDGYACLASDGVSVLKVRDGVAAGDVSAVTLKPGECARINTGAPVPDGADCVVQVEDTKLVKSSEDGRVEYEVEVLVAPTPGQDIRPVGFDITVNEIVVKAGSIIDAGNVGILATVGVNNVPIYTPPRVGVLSTGNELQDPRDEVLTPGHIRDSNKIMLISLLREYNIKTIDLGISRDDPASLKKALLNALQQCDIIISTGSVSMGDKDMLKLILEKDFEAEIHFGRVNMKPGKPTTFATCIFGNETKYVFGLPGNPVSAYVTCLLFVMPALRRWVGEEPEWPEIKVELGNDIGLDPRPEYARAVLQFREDNPVPLVMITGNQCSSRLLSTCGATVLLKLPSSKMGRPVLETGTQVTALITSRIRNVKN